MAVFAEFVMSAASPAQFLTDNLPEIGLVGRSNVGKSSLINSLMRMPKLARTSNTPGRTQTLNFYRIWPEGKPKLGDPTAESNPGDKFSLRGSALQAAQATGAFYFVDMPGYGYAKVSESQRKAWQKLIEQYLLERPNLKGVIQLVDLRHPPSRDDVAMWEWLRHYQRVRLCVATKADKVGRSQHQAHLKQVAQGLGMPAITPPGAGIDPAADPLLLYSSEEGTGRDPLWQWCLNATRL